MQEVTIGRDAECDIVLNHPHVSRRHATITVGHDSLWIQDLGSTNGTYVNGNRIDVATKIGWNDEIRFGDVGFDLDRIKSLARKDIPKSPTLSRPTQPPPMRPQERRTDYQYDRPPERRYDSDFEKASQQGSMSPGYDVVRALKSQESYVGKAFITFIMYLFFWLPGLVINLIFLSDANKTKRIVGVTPSGHGCLVSLLWIFVILPIIFIGLLALVSYGTLVELLESVSRYK